MDESWPSGKHTIDWNHPCDGQLLRFQHDLYELGDLLKEMHDLPAHMEEMRAYLLSVLDGGYSAEDALARLEELCANAEPATCSKNQWTENILCGVLQPK
ncbi:hypothetical protein P3T76_008457 [Phytophthora citrophthora]|nr:hypothetical protein P3T76_008457 [Phytophthora citrophthora]